MKKICLILFLTLTLLLTACDNTTPADDTSTEKETPTNLTENNVAGEEEQIELDVDGLPIMSEENQLIFDTYVLPVANLLFNEFSPEDISALLSGGGDGLLTILEIMETEKMQVYTLTDGIVPAEFVEDILTTRFPLEVDDIRKVCADVYDSENHTYFHMGGIGGIHIIPIVTSISQQDDLLTINYTRYGSDPNPSLDKFQYKQNDSGILTVQITEEDYKYLSNQIIPFK